MSGSLWIFLRHAYLHSVGVGISIAVFVGQSPRLECLAAGDGLSYSTYSPDGLENSAAPKAVRIPPYH